MTHGGNSTGWSDNRSGLSSETTNRSVVESHSRNKVTRGQSSFSNLPSNASPRYYQSMDDRKAELQRFKRIDLCDYAASRGFVPDRRASSKHSMVMRHANGDKLIIGRDSSGKFYYFNAKGSDQGTIIDLTQNLDGGTLGDVRRTLRQFDGSNFVQSPSSTLPFKLQPSQHDAARVVSAWMKTKKIPNGHPYLTDVRGIASEVQRHPIFRDRIRIDSRRNAVFPHFNQSGLCGFELKNGTAERTTFTGFSPGGVKGLACSRPRESDRIAVICETSVDMLSVATLEGTENRRFFSTAGQISTMQAEWLRTAISRMPADSAVLLAMDNDQGGHKLAEQVRESLQTLDVVVEDHFPPNENQDWNDVLQETRRHGNLDIRPQTNDCR